MPTQRASACLLSRIARAALKEFGASDFYVAPSPSGFALSDRHLELLQKPDEDWLDEPDSVARLVEISQLVDCIQRDPQRVMAPTDEGHEFLSDVFPRLLSSVRFAPAPLSPELRRRYEAALQLLYTEPPLIKTPEYYEFCVLRADLEKKDVVLSELGIRRAAAADADQSAALDAEIERLTALTREGREAISAIDRLHSFRAAEEAIDTAERDLDALPASIDRALALLKHSLIADPISQETHTPCSFFPPSLIDGSWARLRLTRADIEDSAGTTTPPAPDELDDQQIESIELDLQTIVCERPWLWSALFSNPGWGWASPSLPIASPGELKNDPGSIPAYIHALVFVRRLSVRGTPRSASALARTSARLALLPALRAPGSSGAKPSSDSLLMRALKSAPAAAAAATAKGSATAKSTASAAARVNTSATPVATGTSAPVKAKLALPAKDGQLAAQLLTPDATLRPRVSVAVQKLIPLLAGLPLAGQVVDLEGRPVPQATVAMIDARKVRRSVVSGRDGKFRFTSVPRGSYRVEAQKTGAFALAAISVTVPQVKEAPLRLTPLANCKVEVRLVEQLENGERPFIGDARVTFRGSTSRADTMDDTASATFFVRPGKLSVSVASSEAESVTPTTLQLDASPSAPATAVFRIRRAPLLQNASVQLLAVVCRRVPPCPRR